MSIEMVTLEWEYEDQLPEMSDLEYDLLYPESIIVEHVRMFPFVRVWDFQSDSEKKYYLSV